MDPNIPSGDEDCNVRNSKDMPSHGTIPKWLEDISQQIVNNHDVRLEKTYSFFDTTDRPNLKPSSGSSSTTFGRRSSLTSQMLSSNLPKNITLTKSDYFIPVLDSNFDIKTFQVDPHEIDLQKSWKSLDHFKQSHKGRLDSAKNFENDPKIDDYVLSSISSGDSYTNSETTPYSPSILEKNVPTRSRSEMCNYYTIQEKSAISRQNKYDPVFEKKLNDYQSKIDKENQLRQDIISELLAENERITNRIKHTLEKEDDIESLSLLYRKYSNSKYKNFKKREKASKDSVFIIPELPTGQTFILDILTTWGDKYYVGLNGIEIFGIDGNLVRVKKISAVPPDVNVLPECHNDPRIVTNLLDGINRTQDDMHIWLAPFDYGCSHIITIEFEEISTIAMMRIWNYNKSRIHSYRGVRDVVMFLDDNPIFKGEIAKACGSILGGIHSFGDTILFTTDDRILESIANHDTSYSFLTSGPSTPNIIERPSTAALTADVRPVTGPATNKSSPTDQILFGASQIDLLLLSNWGHVNMIGLTGLEIVEGLDAIVKVEQIRISCSVKSENSKIVRLVDGVNITGDITHMWSIPYKFGEEVTIRIVFDDFKYVSGIRIWNYNGSLETSYTGVRAMKILLNGTPVTNPITKNEIFILRRAPGNQHYDFVQDIRFIEDLKELEHQEETPSLLDRNEFYEPSSMPEGFVFQFVIFSSWGDQYYCGLNGLELYNQHGKKIQLEEQNICAYPESVNSLPNVSGDIRIPSKLIDGINDDHTGSHSWLAPIIPKHLNRIYIVMDQPTVVSLVKLWNYSKSPSRGIKEFGILVDDLLVYNGTLAKYSNMDNGCQTVLFTENEAIIGEDYNSFTMNSTFSQDVILLDQDLKTTTGGSLPDADPALRPFTSVNLFNRGYTSLSR